MEAQVSKGNAEFGCLAAIGCLVWFIALVVVCVVMGSCTKMMYVPVKEEIHDTVRISKTDTVNHYEVKTEKELVYVKDSSSVVVDEQGNVKSKEKYRETTIIKEKSDSLAHYKAMYDSLLAVKQKEVEKPVVVEKELTKWQKRYITFGKIATGEHIALAIGLIAWLVWRLRRRRCK